VEREGGKRGRNKREEREGGMRRRIEGGKRRVIKVHP